MQHIVPIVIGSTKHIPFTKGWTLIEGVRIARFSTRTQAGLEKWIEKIPFAVEGKYNFGIFIVSGSVNHKQTVWKNSGTSIHDIHVP